MPKPTPVLDRRAVRTAAAAKGYETISDLADAVGVHRVSLYRALSPTAPTAPSLRMLHGLTRALDAEIGDLLAAGAA